MLKAPCFLSQPDHTAPSQAERHQEEAGKAVSLYDRLGVDRETAEQRRAERRRRERVEAAARELSFLSPNLRDRDAGNAIYAEARALLEQREARERSERRRLEEPEARTTQQQSQQQRPAQRP